MGHGFNQNNSAVLNCNLVFALYIYVYVRVLSFYGITNRLMMMMMAMVVMVVMMVVMVTTKPGPP